MLENYIRENYKAALKEFGNQDSDIVNGIRNNNTLDPDIVKGWMRGYGLFQGIEKTNRESLAKAFCENYVAIRDNGKSISENYAILYNCMVKSLETERILISATSKLLWCIFPEKVILYDSFVERAIKVLQHLEPELKNPSLGMRPKEKEGIIQYYFNYSELVNCLYQKYLPLLEELEKTVEPNPDIYRIMVWDKLLWILGNPK
jgi:hypothetical protein